MKTRGQGVFTILAIVFCSTAFAGELSTTQQTYAPPLPLDSGGIPENAATELSYRLDLDPTLTDRSQSNAQDSITSFDEQFSLSIRKPLTDSISFIQTTGVGVNRNPGFLFHKRPDSDGSSSLLINTGGLEWKPAQALTLTVSLLTSREVRGYNAGFNTQSGYAIGAALTPFSGASVSLDFRRENGTGFDGAHGCSNFYFASFDYQFPQSSALSFHADCWHSDNWLNGVSGIAQTNSELEGELSWQINDRIWWSSGIEWDFSKDARAAQETRTRSFKTDLVFQALENVTLSLSLAHGTEQETDSPGQRSGGSWTSIRLNAKMRVAENFRVEVGVGSGDNPSLWQEVLDSNVFYVIAAIRF